MQDNTQFLIAKNAKTVVRIHAAENVKDVAQKAVVRGIAVVLVLIHALIHVRKCVP